MQIKVSSNETLLEKIKLKTWLRDSLLLLRDGLILWENPVWALLFSFLVYWLLAVTNGPIQLPSVTPYYNFLADAFLHGQLNLRLLPPSIHDLVVFEGRYYLYWPPFPAILIMPLIALFGVGFSDILFTLVAGALNVFLVAHILRSANQQQLIHLSAVQRALMVLFFALGTVHITLAPYGRVWYTGQVVGFLCLALAYLLALRLEGWKAFLFTGLAIACAFLTRNHLLFAGLWPAVVLLKKHAATGWRRTLYYTLVGLLPVLLAFGSLAAYNYLRFGSAIEVGLNYHLMDRVFLQDYQKYGAFHPHYFATNFYYQYLAYPFPVRPETYMGGSLFLLSPVFLAAVWGIRSGRPRWSVLALVLTILLVNLPILFLMGTGWIQFGPRYTLDFSLPLMLLTALGLRNWPAWVLGILVIISLIHYVSGAIILMDVM